MFKKILSIGICFWLVSCPANLFAQEQKVRTHPGKVLRVYPKSYITEVENMNNQKKEENLQSNQPDSKPDKKALKIIGLGEMLSEKEEQELIEQKGLDLKDVPAVFQKETEAGY